MTRLQKSIALLALVSLMISGCGSTPEQHALTNQVPDSTNDLTIDSWQTKNGARVLFVHAPQLPMVDVRIVFDAGSARDNGKAGLASFTNSHGARCDFCDPS